MEMIAKKDDIGVTVEAFSQLYPRLYHMAHEDALASIQRHRLLSTSSILKMWEVKDPLRTSIDSRIRRETVEIWHPTHGRAVIRDQKPMRESQLSRALVDCTPAEWCQLLNRKIFFWPSIERLKTHMSARENRGKKHLVLTVDARSFLSVYQENVTLCAMNSGNTIPFAHERGRDSFMKMSEYPFQSRRNRGTYYTVVEVALDTDIPDIVDFPMSANHMTAAGMSQEIGYQVGRKKNTELFVLTLAQNN